jgi:hypothetical protein
MVVRCLTRPGEYAAGPGLYYGARIRYALPGAVLRDAGAVLDFRV